MEHECWDCGGTGKKNHYHMIDSGICYTCKGTGKTNLQQGEINKQHTEREKNIASHYQIEQRIKKGEEMINAIASTIGKKIKNNYNITEDMKTLEKYNNLLKSLELEKTRLEGVIKW